MARTSGVDAAARLIALREQPDIETAEAVIVALVDAIHALIPMNGRRGRPFRVECWCSTARDVVRCGHAERCLLTRAALAQAAARHL